MASATDRDRGLTPIAMSGADLEDADRDLARTTDHADAPPGLAGEFETREALDELLDGDLEFQSGEVRADAAVDTEAERRMPVLLAIDDEGVGILELQRVTVGRREGQELGRLDRLVAPLGTEARRRIARRRQGPRHLAHRIPELNEMEFERLGKAFNAMAKIAAPCILLKSEAIVHPDEVVKYIHPDECQLSYNPLLMALLWESLATTEVKFLEHSMRHRNRVPAGCTWVNYLRCHDDIGWSFDDVDARLACLRTLLEHRVLEQLFLDELTQLHARHLQQLDRLLQLRRHGQLLAQLELK